MADTTGSAVPPPPTPKKDYGRAGRNVPVSIASAVVLLGAAGLTLFFWKTAFIALVGVVLIAGIWELRRGLMAKELDLPEQPLMLGGTVMIVVTVGIPLIGGLILQSLTRLKRRGEPKEKT